MILHVMINAFSHVRVLPAHWLVHCSEVTSTRLVLGWVTTKDDRAQWNSVYIGFSVLTWLTWLEMNKFINRFKMWWMCFNCVKLDDINCGSQSAIASKHELFATAASTTIVHYCFLLCKVWLKIKNKHFFVLSKQITRYWWSIRISLHQSNVAICGTDISWTADQRRLGIARHTRKLCSPRCLRPCFNIVSTD